jgi:voltage-gated potassium channel
VLQPNVAEFLDVVMHDEGVEFRLEEMAVASGSALVGRPLRELYRDAHSEARVLALRDGERFVTNPSPDIELAAGHVLIVIGTNEELAALRGGLGIHPVGDAPARR